ncbi:Mitochondrial substrate/solute carrier [Phaffia rhodozyma]|uniref:Mitochondrial substrate/solute carrier n=1 Tax=Phaffia rhodozyma TaxID=264483 RepID=A0A0F7SW31_PHARH|nr:Mitochondrial substrate/solute carrier [Phaffia rhodozyma]
MSVRQLYARETVAPPALVLPEASRSNFPSLSSTTNQSFKSYRDQFVWTLGTSFLSSFLAQPFESGKVLSQIQYLPRKRLLLSGGASANATSSREPPPVSEEPIDPTELSDEEDAQAYFEDLVTEANRANQEASLSVPIRPRETDVDGYVVRRPSFRGRSTGLDRPEDLGEAKLEWIMEIGYSGDGPWAMTKRLWNEEGPAGPWKGLTLSFFLDNISTFLPRFLSSFISPFFPSLSAPLYTRPSLAMPPRSIWTPLFPALLSQTLSGFLLSPLSLLHTRLIAQPTHRLHRTYSPTNPLQGLATLRAQAGSWATLYFHPRLLWPTLLDVTVRAGVALSIPIIIEHVLGFSSINSPLAYKALEAALNIGSLVVTLPLETARRRLQLQSIGPTAEQPFKTCVEIRPAPYAGVGECLYRIVTEESVSGGDGWFGGVKQLYRGLGMNFLATSAVVGLELGLWALGGESGRTGGERWMEI